LSAEQPNSSPPPGAAPLWGSFRGSGPPVETEPASSSRSPRKIQLLKGDGELDPLSRRLFGAAVFLSVLLLLVLANSFLNGGGEDPLELNPVAAAAERTQDEPGARFSIEATYSSPALPQPMAADGQGAYNSVTGLGEVQMGLEVPGVGRVNFETISDATSYYMRSDKPELLSIPGGKEWMKVEPFLGGSFSEVAAGGDANSSLQMLGAAGAHVDKIGEAKVRGKQTTRYRGTITLADVASTLREEGEDELADVYEKYAALNPAAQTAEAWIDGDGFVRRMRMVMELPIENQLTMTMDMQMELFDFGAEPAIALPDDDAVFDATPLLEEQLDAAETN
jgi:hypothetical protein